MTALIILLGAFLVANTILLSLIWMTLRYGFRMLLLQGSRRQQRAREEHT
jgi:hypothetical protein